MKKLWLLISIPVLALTAYLIWQNLPSKRYAKHIVKARLYLRENELTAARFEYEKAYNATGKFTPYASAEVLTLSNRLSLRDKNFAEALNNTRLFVQENPSHKEGKITLAQLALQVGETETAFNAIDTLLKIDPLYFPARLLLANLRARQGRLDLAEEQLRYLSNKFPDSAKALLPLAENLLQQGQLVEGRNFLNQVIAMEPKNGQARLMMVDSYINERKIDSAQMVLDAWKDSDPEHSQTLQIRKARLFSMSNHPKEALDALSAYRQVKEGNLVALSEVAILFAKQSQFDSAIAIYKSMGEGVPRSRSSSEIMSYYLYMKNQNPARALEAMKQVQISDKRPALMAPLIAAYLAIGQDQKAKEFISQQPDTAQKGLTEFMSKLLPDKDFIGQWALCTYFEMNHQDAAAFLAIQELYKKWPKSDLAIQMYAAQLSAIRAFGEAAKVLSTLPDPNLTQQVALVQLWTSARQGEKAIVLAEKIADEHPNLKGIHAVLGDFWMQKDKLKALAYFEKELVNNPNNIIVLNNLAWEYGIVQKDLTKVMPILNRLKQEKNLDPRILDTMGWILAQNGKADEAENYIRNAMTIVPDFPTFLYHMGFIQSQLGKKVEAKKYLENALASKIPFEERKDVETLLATF